MEKNALNNIAMNSLTMKTIYNCVSCFNFYK